jgi:hypothetical protein
VVSTPLLLQADTDDEPSFDSLFSPARLVAPIIVAAERLLRLAGASVRRRGDRRRSEGPVRLPRTPEQAAAQAAGSPPPVARSG